jgi:hypothetical protein
MDLREIVLGVAGMDSTIPHQWSELLVHDSVTCFLQRATAVYS